VQHTVKTAKCYAKLTIELRGIDRNKHLGIECNTTISDSFR
jgi:hypothetical protein